MMNAQSIHSKRTSKMFAMKSSMATPFYKKPNSIQGRKNSDSPGAPSFSDRPNIFCRSKLVIDTFTIFLADGGG